MSGGQITGSCFDKHPPGTGNASNGPATRKGRAVVNSHYFPTGRPNQTLQVLLQNRLQLPGRYHPGLPPLYFAAFEYHQGRYALDAVL